MTKAFCPGHISCFFSPVRTDNVMTTGSTGAGIRLNKGVTVTLEERRDGKTVTIMDGKHAEAKISEAAVTALAPGRGFDMIIDNELPVSQGFGMSAAGAVAAGLCAAAASGKEEQNAYEAAHAAEVRNGGGLGDVAGILGGRQPIRVSAGIPPYGRTVDTGIRTDVTVAVLGVPVDTKKVLSDEKIMKKITSAGKQCVTEYLNSQTEKILYDVSARFSYSIGLETKDVTSALRLLRKDHSASMCMLGNSIFTNADEERTRELLGDGIVIISCSSGDEGPRLIRKA
ncbi:MAG: pantothenate kinase [Methanomassiliicoccaceae archaeon]|jgi:pantoate kinase|nr:pantothenate kinase [Methanomassiliicoccaceae archaeon]